MTTPTRRANLDLVASAAGVSRMTVSNVYNRPEVVAPETRERVLAAAAELGYGGPSPVGRNLRRGSTNVLGLLIRVGLPDAFADPAAAEFMRGIAQGCDEADLSLQIVHATGPSATQRVNQAAVDAFVAWSLAAEDAALAAAVARRVPVVAFGGTDELEDVPYVCSDNRGGARELARHVLAGGVEHLAIVTCHLQTKEFAERLAGWREAAQEAGLDWDEVVQVDEPLSGRPYGRDASEQLVDVVRPGGRWGVLAMTDALALGVLQGFEEAGVRCPEDVAVAGYDDIVEAATSTPPLTTVRQDIAELGRECALRAAGRITGPTSPHATSLVVRESTTPAEEPR